MASTPETHGRQSREKAPLEELELNLQHPAAVESFRVSGPEDFRVSGFRCSGSGPCTPNPPLKCYRVLLGFQGLGARA